MSCQNAIDIIKAQQFLQLDDQNLAYWIDGNETQQQSNLAIKLYLPLTSNQTIDKVVLVVDSILLETRYLRNKAGFLPSYLLFHRLNLTFAKSLNLLIGVTDGKTYTTYAKTLGKNSLKANRLANWCLPKKEIIFSANALRKDLIYATYQLPNMTVEISHTRECKNQSFLLPKVNLSSMSANGGFDLKVDLSTLPTNFLATVKTIFVTDPVGHLLGYTKPSLAQLTAPVSVNAIQPLLFEKDFKTKLTHQPKVQECPFLRVLVDMDTTGSLTTSLNLH